MRLPTLRAPRPSTVFYVLVAILASAPAWIVRHPPLEDLPFHLATLRVVHDYGNPAYGFEKDFYLNIWHTSYVLYYLVGSALAYVLGVYKAHIAMMCLYLGGTPLAMRDLLRALGKDERLSLFAVPLVVNVMFMMGLLPYVFGIPLMLLAIAASVRWFEKPTRNRGIWLAVVSVVLFFAHVFPYALFGIAFAAMFPWTRPREWVRAGAPAVPSLLCVVWWVRDSAAGKASAHALGSGAPAPLDQKLTGFFGWSIDVFNDTSDEKWFVILVVVAVLALGLSQGDVDRSKPISRPYALVVVTCIVAYVLLGDHLGDVWLFAERFPAPGLLLAIPLLRFPRGWRGWAILAGVLWVGVGSTVNVCRHFIKFELEEVGDIDDAIASMAPSKRVCGLIYDKGSSIVHYAPFLHFVSYYQAEKGGVTMFSYASFPHWPFRFREGHYPPPGRPARLRWEWTPEQTPINEIYPYYDYVLVRGYGFHPPHGTYHVTYHGDHWTVWSRD
jgi:hypothetical protein